MRGVQLSRSRGDQQIVHPYSVLAAILLADPSLPASDFLVQSVPTCSLQVPLA